MLEFIENLEVIYNLIQELPDKPTEPSKIGFREDISEERNLSSTAFPNDPVPPVISKVLFLNIH